MQQHNNAFPTKREEVKATIALICTTVVWGMGFIFQRIGLDAGLTPATLNVGRFVLAAIVLGLIFFKSIRKHYKKGQWKYGVLIGTMLFFASHVQTVGMQYTTPSNSAFITAMYVVMVPFGSWIFTKVRPKGLSVLACLMSFVGVVILSADFSGGFSMGFGDALTFISAILFAFQIVFIDLWGEHIHYTVLAFLQMAGATFWALVLFVAEGAPMDGFTNPTALGAIIYLGLFSTALCFCLQTYGQHALSSARAGILLSCESLFGTLFSVILGYDKPGLRMVIGGALIFVAMVLPELWTYLRGRGAKRAAAQRAGEEAPPR